MVRGDCNTMPQGSGVYSRGEGPFCRNDRYATLRLQTVLEKAMPSQGRMKQQESLYEYQLVTRSSFLGCPSYECDCLCSVGVCMCCLSAYTFRENNVPLLGLSLLSCRSCSLGKKKACMQHGAQHTCSKSSCWAQQHCAGPRYLLRLVLLAIQPQYLDAVLVTTFSITIVKAVSPF
ncbi:UNVERIFIED_CONTAM: hypothetical protein FKN15_014021 [Acipenser sinensis]